MTTTKSLLGRSGSPHASERGWCGCDPSCHRAGRAALARFYGLARTSSISVGASSRLGARRGRDDLAPRLGAFEFCTATFSSSTRPGPHLPAVIIEPTWLWVASLSLMFGPESTPKPNEARELRPGGPPNANSN